jgi:hypothetical protein
MSEVVEQYLAQEIKKLRAENEQLKQELTVFKALREFGVSRMNNGNSCMNCVHRKSYRKDGIDYAICKYADKYKITCTVSKCPEHKIKMIGGVE